MTIDKRGHFYFRQYIIVSDFLQIRLMVTSELDVNVSKLVHEEGVGSCAMCQFIVNQETYYY